MKPPAGSFADRPSGEIGLVRVLRFCIAGSIFKVIIDVGVMQ